ncbi:transglycosylase SLT domain-containing protein [Fundidesulfovibrio butyratiphilus]
MLTTDQHHVFIAEAAVTYGLPPDLVAAVVRVESGGNPLAFRFESAFLKRYVLPNASVKAKAPCSLETERQARAMSWGLMQVMGETARGLGFDGPYLSALTDPATGLDYGCRLLARLKARYLSRHGWAGIVAAYNAGSVRFAPDGCFVNQAYVNAVAKALGGRWPE